MTEVWPKMNSDRSVWVLIYVCRGGGKGGWYDGKGQGHKMNDVTHLVLNEGIDAFTGFHWITNRYFQASSSRTCCLLFIIIHKKYIHTYLHAHTYWYREGPLYYPLHLLTAHPYPPSNLSNQSPAFTLFPQSSVHVALLLQYGSLLLLCREWFITPLRDTSNLNIRLLTCISASSKASHGKKWEVGLLLCLGSSWVRRKMMKRDDDCEW